MYKDPTEIYVSYLSDGTATVANVRVFTNEFSFNGSGHSDRMPGDPNDAELGRLLALQRALGSALASIEAKTARLIEVNDKAVAQAANYRTKEQWEQMQRNAAKASHPSGKSAKVGKAGM